MTKVIRVLDLFSGAGGFSLGFKNAGFKICGAIEINQKYAETHEKNFNGSITICADIRDLSPEKFSKVSNINPGEIDVIIGGPPCQSFSTIGTPKINSISGNKHNVDPRSYLYEEFFSYIKYFKPRLFVMENVPAMKTKFKGQLFENILKEIIKIKYSTFNGILNSVNYGVPQNRKRLFIVGFREKIRDYQFPDITHYSPKDVLANNTKLKKYNTVYDALDDMPEIYDGIRAGDLPYSKKKPTSSFQKIMRNGVPVVGNNICRMSNERAKKIFEYMKQGDRYMDLPARVRNILPFREDIFHDRLKRLSMNEPSWTILAHIGMDGYMYIHPTETRTISVREAARLQSFKDDFKFVGNMREQYIQVGNSVPPLLAQAIANSLKTYLL